ncbi:hypothetical protein DAC22_8 [Bacteroides phage DAC22]|nr:hypothetical protein DAC22_8 [Bacteroides phage DAC22]
MSSIEDKIKEEVAFDKMNNKLSDTEISILYLIRSSLPNPNECEDKNLVILYSENLAFKNSKYSSNNKSFLTEFEFEKKELVEYDKENGNLEGKSIYKWFLVRIDNRILNHEIRRTNS